jgi:hypothetical protein
MYLGMLLFFVHLTSILFDDAYAFFDLFFMCVLSNVVITDGYPDILF